MVQSMKFTHSNSSVDISEMYDDKQVRMRFWNSAGYTNGYVDFDERRLTELRNWINIQLTKMKQKKK